MNRERQIRQQISELNDKIINLEEEVCNLCAELRDYED